MEPNSILVGTHPEMLSEEFTLLEEKIMDIELQVEIKYDQSLSFIQITLRLWNKLGH